MKEPVASASESHHVRFGVFDVDFRTGELRKQGIRIKLQEKPFQLLAALLERAGDVVTREELRKRLWGDQTYVDFERSLNIAITKLRAALGDSAESPRFIETLPRRGYRFIVPEIGGTESTVGASLSGRAPETTHVNRAILRGAFVAVAIAVAALATGFFPLKIGSLEDRLVGKTKPLQLESIAVLPLENFSGDPEQEYLADGMTDALINALGRMRAFRVISRTSIMRYKTTRKSLPEIARELRVDGVVEGAVVRSGDRIRVTAQLLHASSDRHLWARSFERDVRDVMALQDDLGAAVANAIQANVDQSRQTSAPVRAARPVDPEAWTLYLKGRYFWARRGADDLKKGLEYFQQAINKDPNYALAYAGLADSYLLLAATGVSPPGEVVAKGTEAALKALQLDETLAEAHTSLAGIKCTYEADWVGAEKEYKRALEINPNYAIAHQWWAQTLAGLGRHVEAAAEIKRAQEIDPLSLLSSSAAGQILYYARQYEQALEQYRNTLELDPNYAPAHVGLGRVYRELGLRAQALAELENGASLFKRHSSSLAFLGHAYGVFGQRDRALKILAELEEQSDHTYVSPLNRAIVYLGLNDYDQAFRWLHQAAAQHANSLGFLKAAAEFDPLRSDPRFPDLLRRVALTP